MIAAAKNTILGAKFIQGQVNLSQARKPELFGDDADNFARLAVDHNLLAQSLARATETSLPKRVCDQNYISAAGQIVGLGKIAAKFWRQAENAKKVPSHPRSADSFWIGFAGLGRKIGAIAPKQRQIGKAPLSRTPIKIVWITDCAGVEGFGSFAQKNEPLGIRIRQWPQKKRVDHTEDRGVGADPECQGEGRDKGETGMFSQLPNGVPNFSDHRFLFRAQGDDGIDPAGATRRDPAGKESGTEKHRSDLEVNSRVNAADFEKDALQKMRDRDRASQSNG